MQKTEPIKFNDFINMAQNCGKNLARARLRRNRVEPRDPTKRKALVQCAVAWASPRIELENGMLRLKWVNLEQVSVRESSSVQPC